MDTNGSALKAANVLCNLFLASEERGPDSISDADGASDPEENADGSATFTMTGLVYPSGVSGRRSASVASIGQVVYTVTVKCEYIPHE